MKIYTKTGDKGKTSLLGGKRIEKDSIRISAYGTVDECNALLGIARTFELPKILDEMLEKIQNKMFELGSDLSTPGNKKTMIPRIGEKDVEQLEKWIDQLQESLPPLEQFILPGGCRAAAFLHLARTVCRRAERYAVALLREESASTQAGVFLNRLSDFLFVAARSANHLNGIEDTLWNSPRKHDRS